MDTGTPPTNRKAAPMNRLLLQDLQRRRSFPSVTVLLNARPGASLDPADVARLDRLVAQAAHRVAAEAPGPVGDEVVDQLRRLAVEQLDGPPPVAFALCASPEIAVVVRLGQEVRERVVVDDTFATRDLVADLARSARYRVVAVSEQKVRMFLGDRRRLVEVLDDRWPLLREEGQRPTSWAREVFDQLRLDHAELPLPAVVAGVERSVRRLGVDGAVMVVGEVPGNHDRTSASELHALTWPEVDRYLEVDRVRALARLDEARSSRRFAGGIDEVWSLANDGRVDLVLVEESFEVSAHLDPEHQLLQAHQLGRAVVDDIVDDTIEAVLLRGGRAVLVPDDQLAEHDHIAAVLRY